MRLIPDGRGFSGVAYFAEVAAAVAYIAPTKGEASADEKHSSAGVPGFDGAAASWKHLLVV